MVEFLNTSIVETIVFTFGFLIGAVIISEILLFILDKVVKPLTAKTKTTLDDRILEAIKTPVRLFGIIIGVYLTVKPIYPTYVFLGNNIEFWLVTTLILWAGLLVSNLINAFILWYYLELAAQEQPNGAKTKLSTDFVPMLRRLVKVAVYLITLIIILGRFGIEITPLITALGIGGLAVALAVKDTLANFFAGLYLLSDKPIKVGEYIALDNESSPIKGFVEEIGWRTTRIRTRGNFTYFVPNEKITLNNVVNFSRGQSGNWKGASITITVPFDSNVNKIKEIILASIEAVKKKSALVNKETTPFIRLEEITGGKLTFKAFYRVNNYFETEAAAGEIREQIVADFKKKKVKL